MTVAGLVLLLVGAGLLVGEAHIASAGLLAALGTVAAVAGTVLAVQGAGGGLVLAVVLAFVVAVLAGGLSALALGAVVRSSGGRVRSGREALIGCTGRARTAIGEGVGRVFVDGSLWRARNAFPDEPVQPDAAMWWSRSTG